jgi:hypothetical protein
LRKTTVKNENENLNPLEGFPGTPKGLPGPLEGLQASPKGCPGFMAPRKGLPWPPEGVGKNNEKTKGKTLK